MLRAISLTVILATVVMAGSPALAQEPRLLDSPGVWTLHELGYEDIWLEAGGGRVEVLPNATYRYASPVEYLLPEDAAQGPNLWYLIHMHFEIMFQDDSGEGEVEVMARVSGRLPALVVFNTSRPNDSLRIGWETLGLPEGRQRGTSDSRRVELWFSNYLSDRAVVPGRNIVEFAITEYGDARFARLHVFNDTSIEVTKLSPPELEIEPDIDEWHAPADVSQPFEVPYVIRNVGGWPAKDIVVEVTHPNDVLRLLGEPSVPTALLEGGQEVRGSFKFEASSTGAHEISLRVYGRTGGMDEALITVSVGSAGGVSKARYWLLVALVIGVSTLPLMPLNKVVAIITGTKETE